jgi:septal ring factor EnvC (AmiA/AmiB activator)
MPPPRLCEGLMTDLENRLLERVLDRLDEHNDKLSDMGEGVAAMRQEVAAFIASASTRIDDLEHRTAEMSKTLTRVLAFAYSSSGTVLVVLSVVGYFLSTIPAEAWRGLQK